MAQREFNFLHYSRVIKTSATLYIFAQSRISRIKYKKTERERSYIIFTNSAHLVSRKKLVTDKCFYKQPDLLDSTHRCSETTMINPHSIVHNVLRWRNTIHIYVLGVAMTNYFLCDLHAYKRGFCPHVGPIPRCRSHWRLDFTLQET